MNVKESNVQVDVQHYDFKDYVDIERWNSYYHQLVETVELKPKDVLIIGMGDNIVGRILNMQGIDVYTYDFDKELHPDFVGDVADIDIILQGRSFDVILICQILEHLPYSQFEDVLKKMKSVSSNIIMSLPYSPINLSMSVKLSHFNTKRIHIGIHQWWKEFKFCGEHYWEIGRRKYTKERIKNSIEKYFSITKCFLAAENHYHMFYVLKHE